MLGPAGRGGCCIVVLMIETCLALPKLAHGQFLGVFDSIFSSIQNDIGSSLKTINQITQQMQKLYQTTVAPLGGDQPGPRLRRELDQRLSRADESDFQYLRSPAR